METISTFCMVLDCIGGVVKISNFDGSRHGEVKASK